MDVTGIAVNDILTLSFEGRWVSGLPLLVSRHGTAASETSSVSPFPETWGTPGAANSVTVAAAPPTVDALMHSPAVPTSSQPVIITARVTSADALTSVMLNDRVDTVTGTGTYTQTAMNDSGTGSDAVASDGIWSVTLAPRRWSHHPVFCQGHCGQINECPRHPLRVAGVNGTTLEEQERPAMYIVDNSPATTVPGISSQRFILSCGRGIP